MIKQPIGKLHGEVLYYVSAQTPEERTKLGIAPGMTGYWQTESGARFDDPEQLLKLTTSHFSEGGPNEIKQLTTERKAREIHREIYREQREMILNHVAEKRKQFQQHPDPRIRAMLMEGLQNLAKIYGKKDTPLVDPDGVFRPDEETKKRIYGEFVNPGVE